MSRLRTRITLPLAGLVLTIALLMLAACGGGASGQSGNGSASGGGTVTNNQGTPAATVSGQAGTSTAPLPSDVPSPPNASLQREYSSQINGKTATVWQYVIPASGSATPNNVASLYQQQMPSKGWTTTTISNDAGALITAGLFQKSGTLTSVSAAYSHGNYGPVVVIITVAGK